MLIAPNGDVRRCDGALGKAKMPDGYELWRDEDGYYWWHHTASGRESVMHWSRWAVRKGAVLDAAKH